ncbi:MAG: hypothetical protein ACTSVA_03045 [Candidatus Njordarchaeales archaeon]
MYCSAIEYRYENINKLYPLKRDFSRALRDEIELLNEIILIDERTLGRPQLLEQNIWPKILAKRLDKKIIEILRKYYEEKAENLTYIPMAGGYYLVLKLPDTVIRLDYLGMVLGLQLY